MNEQPDKTQEELAIQQLRDFVYSHAILPQTPGLKEHLTPEQVRRASPAELAEMQRLIETELRKKAI